MNGAAPLVEIRVHGVSGTPPEEMLTDPHPELIGGDEVARFFRRTKALTGQEVPRRIEAFHWGRMTAGSPTKALWLMLAPFGLLNTARFMLPMKVEKTTPTADGAQTWVETGGRLRIGADAALRLLGLTLTLMLLAAVSSAAVDLIGWQCGGLERCIETNSWLPFEKHGGSPYGLRLLVTLSAPMALLFVLTWFGHQVNLYPPSRGTSQKRSGELMPWQHGVGALAARWFWHTNPRSDALRALHGTAGIALMTWLIGMSSLQAASHGLASPLQRGWEVGIRIAAWTALAVLAIVAGLVAIGGLYGKQLRALIGGADDGKELTPEASGANTVLLNRSISVTRVVAIVLLVFTAPVAIWQTWSPATSDRGLDAFDDTIGSLYVAAAVLLVVLLVCTAVLATKTKPAQPPPKSFRPMWFGLASPAAATLATFLASGFTAGAVIQVARLLGTPAPPYFACQSLECAQVPIEVPPVLWITAFSWSITAAVAVGLGVAASLGRAVVNLARRLRYVLAKTRHAQVPQRRQRVYDAIAGQYKDDIDLLADRTVKKIAQRWWIASFKFHTVFLAVVALIAGLAIVFQAILALSRLGMLPPGGQPLADVAARIASRQELWSVILGDAGAWLVTGLILGLAFLGARAFRNPTLRRGVGVLWDLISFWPRLIHPLAPAPYGGRAVLALTEHATKTSQDNGNPKVILAGHSQGSLICAAAACCIIDEERAAGSSDNPRAPWLHLLTFGSQLQWAYARFFPAFVGYPILKDLYGALDGRWRNLHRWTDWLGAPVLAYPDDGVVAGTNLPSDARPWRSLLDGSAVAMGDTNTAALYLGHDVRFRDPMWMKPPKDKPLAPLLGHSGYYEDPAYDDVLGNLLSHEKQETTSKHAEVPEQEGKAAAIPVQNPPSDG